MRKNEGIEQQQYFLATKKLLESRYKVNYLQDFMETTTKLLLFAIYLFTLTYFSYMTTEHIYYLPITILFFLLGTRFVFSEVFE